MYRKKKGRCVRSKMLNNINTELRNHLCKAHVKCNYNVNANVACPRTGDLNGSWRRLLPKKFFNFQEYWL